MVVSGAHVVSIQVRQPVLDGVELHPLQGIQHRVLAYEHGPLIADYNAVRPHQALGSLMPEQVYNGDAA